MADRQESWAVTVDRNGDQVVTIASNCLAGRDLSTDDERVIETAARHLLSFLGKPAPPAALLSLHRCKVCGTRWLLWPDAIHGGGWNLLDRWQRPGGCCDNVAMGAQIEHLRDIPLSAGE